MGVGRFACVALPFGLSLASLICLLIVMTAGVTHKNIDMFDVTVKDLSISSNSLKNLVNLKRDIPLSGLTTAAQSPGSLLNGQNLTAKELGLADSYKVYLWNYCSFGNSTSCSKGKFDWASDSTNTTELETLATTVSGEKTELPKEVKGALKTFAVVSKWTQVVYIIAIISVAAELVLGAFGFCSRIGSCATFIVNGISGVAIVIASAMSTASSSLVVGAVKATGRAYGIQANLNTSFIGTTWLAAAFSIGAGLFWMFTICCCASKTKKNRSSVGDKEKLIPTGSYQRVGSPANFNDGHTGYAGGSVPMHNVRPQRGNGAYEPYSHAAV